MKTIKAFIFIWAVFAGLTAKAQDAALSSAFNKVIDSYMSLKDALAANDGNAAESKAQDLLTALNNVPKEKMNSKQQQIYTRYEAKLQFDARHISEVNRIEHQREHFSSLSNNLYVVLRAIKLNTATLYRQYCEMGKQYFMTNNEKGKSPYMGMSGCNKTTDTLPGTDDK